MTGVRDESTTGTPDSRGGRGPMAITMTVVQAVIGLAGLALIILGFGFWAGKGLNLVPLHEKLGILVVILLWAVALAGFAYDVSKALIATTIVWGFVVVAFGFAQTGMMVGDLHWIIRVLHLIVGLAALVLAARIAKRISVASMAKS